MKKLFTLFLGLFFSISLFSNDTLKVHFLYGSKPKKKFKYIEKKWFGGIHGGHVGIEIKKNEIIDFVPYDGFHYFEKNKNRKSKFVAHSHRQFYSIFGGNADSVKKVIFYIPISPEDASKLDNVSTQYLNETPYDYAFIGMRCGAAAYDFISQIGITKRYSRKRMYLKIFYPKKLRKRLFKLARKNNWKYELKNGSYKREWEKD